MSNTMAVRLARKKGCLERFLRLTSNDRPIFGHHMRQHNHYCTASTLSQKETRDVRWKLYSAVCLERLPIITQEMSEIESQFQELLHSVEYEYSMLSDHELQHIEDQKLSELKKQDTYEETEADAVRVTAAELEDKWDAEFQQFQAADRITEADKSNDMKSSNRHLDRKLVLMVKQKLGEESKWVMPQIAWQDGESLRQTAERTLKELCGSGLQARFLGNAPCGFYKYKFPPSEKDALNADGAKVFFFKAQLQKGSLQNVSSDVEDFVWTTTTDMKNYLSASYGKEVNRFVLDF